MNESDSCPQALNDFKSGFEEIYGYLGIVVCIFSILINCCNTIVLSRNHMITPTNRILLCIAMSDLCISLMILPQLIILYVVKTNQISTNGTVALGWTIFYAISFYSTLTLHTFSVWLCVLLGIFRWFIIRYYPSYHVKRYFGVKRVGVAIFCTLAAVILVLTPYYASLNIQSSNPSSNASEIAQSNQEVDFNSSMGMPHSGADNYTAYHISGNAADQRLIILIGTFAKVVPSLLSLLFSCLIMSTLQSANTRRKSLTQEGIMLPAYPSRCAWRRRSTHRRTTCMLVCIMFLFTAVELPQGVLIVLFTFNHSIKCVYMSFGDFFDALSLIKNITIFVLYCSMSTEYRTTCCHAFLRLKERLQL